MRLPALVCILAISLPALVAACDPPKDAPPPAPSAMFTSEVTAGRGPGPMPVVVPTASAAPTAPEREVAGAAHVLVAYKGAENAPKTVARSKADAKKRAEEAHKKLSEGKATFEQLVKEYSDDSLSKGTAGQIGNFERNAMPEAFSTATFKLEVGATSGVVESPRGFHIIRRTK
jgi:hypothetical protein